MPIALFSSTMNMPNAKAELEECRDMFCRLQMAANGRVLPKWWILKNKS